MQLLSSARAKRVAVGAFPIGTTRIKLAPSGAFAVGRPAQDSEATSATMTQSSETPPGPLNQDQADTVARLFAREIAGDANPTAQESVPTTRQDAVAALMPASGTAKGNPSGLE